SSMVPPAASEARNRSRARGAGPPSKDPARASDDLPRAMALFRHLESQARGAGPPSKGPARASDDLPWGMGLFRQLEIVPIPPERGTPARLVRRSVARPARAGRDDRSVSLGEVAAPAGQVRQSRPQPESREHRPPDGGRPTGWRWSRHP